MTWCVSAIFIAALSFFFTPCTRQSLKSHLWQKISRICLIGLVFGVLLWIAILAFDGQSLLSLVSLSFAVRACLLSSESLHKFKPAGLACLMMSFLLNLWA